MALTPFIRSPNQAAQVFGTGSAPRQKHVFMLRFTPYATGSNLGPLTFAVKHCDRPKVTIKSEELNQYNKKRHVYTGFKLEPIRIIFYDGADGAAQNMWTAYSRYYFGDFATNASNGYSYDDITTNNFYAGNGYGLTEGYSTAASPSSVSANGISITAQWFFSHIDIYHFYDQKFDQYTLINPRIINYEPDELDYEGGTVSQISIQLVYENLQYNPGQAVSSVTFDEFNTVGAGYSGEGLAVPGFVNSTLNTTQFNPLQPSNPLVGSLLANVTSATPPAAPYRNVSTMATGAISTYGNYSFGQATTPNTTNSNSVNSAQFDIANSSVNSVLTTQYGTAGSTLTQAALSTNGAQATGTGTVQFADWDNPGPNAPSSGLTLSPSAYTAINTQQTGTAQYGTTVSA